MTFHFMVFAMLLHGTDCLDQEFYGTGMQHLPRNKSDYCISTILRLNSRRMCADSWFHPVIHDAWLWTCLLSILVIRHLNAINTWRSVHLNFLLEMEGYIRSTELGIKFVSALACMLQDASQHRQCLPRCKSNVCTHRLPMLLSAV